MPDAGQAAWWHILFPAGLYLLLASLYFFAIPIGESPDEPGHLVCIEQVAQYSRLPVMEPKQEGDVWWAHGRIIAGHMCYHMPLYYLVAGYALKGVAMVTDTAVTYTFPPTSEYFMSQNAMFRHEPYAFGQTPEPITLSSLRLLSVTLGFSLVWGSYVLTRRLAPEYPLFAVLAAVLAAGWPQLAYLSRAITNDALATALAVLILVMLANVARPYRFMFLAILSSLAALSKISVAFVIGAILIVWLIEFVQFQNEKRAYLKALLMSSAIWLFTFLFLTHHSLLSKHLTISIGAFSAASPRAATLAYWQEVFMLTLSSGWARLGWMNLPAPLWHAYAWWGVLSLAVVAGFTLCWRLAKSRQQRTLLLICLVWIAIALLSYLRINFNRLQPQFRFILAVVPVLTAGTAVGCLYGVRQRPFLQWGIIAGVAAFLVGYNVWFIFTAVQETYGWYL
ncbi:MAG: hypothetical protein L0332_01380 [Chloroflexi bacterium]|nr:hypothetical protein [Chloroflexota bacterium]MCI0649606.1 hypothetical protein [Chloroflexota bacterium]MCI0725374.1 hypothetical protein [Chloroflexota bacterium]